MCASNIEAIRLNEAVESNLRALREMERALLALTQAQSAVSVQPRRTKRRAGFVEFTSRPYP